MPLIKIKFTGLDEYINKIEQLSGNAKIYVGKAIYDGAKVVADNTKKALESLPTDDSKTEVGEQRKSIRTLQKKGLIESFGIAPERVDGGSFLNVKTGFDGYNKLITPRWPIGQPNAMIARSLESGTSFMPKNRVISRATNASKDECLKAMEKSLKRSIEEIMK